MALVDDLNTRLRDAMRARDAKTVSVLRMVKTKITEKKTSPGFEGDITDEITLQVIAAYSKQLRKALVEYEQTGDRGAEMRAELKFEIDYLSQLLPKMLGEGETREIVEKALKETGITDAKQAGRIVGHIMKSHRGRVDATLVKKLVDDLLSSKV